MHLLSCLKVAATVRAMREELPAVPSDIAKLVGEYMASHGWEGVGRRLTL
jgi:hypothetical protein